VSVAGAALESRRAAEALMDRGSQRAHH
jgi:hypothetical protein